MALHLVVPGLFDRVAGAGGGAPYVPQLERLLARGTRAAGAAGYAATLFELFGIRPAADSDLPTAALCYLADSGEPPDGPLLHADPVHLVADQDRVLLFTLPSQALSAAAAAAYVRAFNTHFAADGLELLVPQPGRWYLRSNAPLRLHSTPLAQVAGRNIDPYLPRGPDAALWRQRLTEVQMLFHALAADAGESLTVNALWFSGGGALPEPPRRAVRLRGDLDPLLRGLVQLGEVAGGAEPLTCHVRLDLLASAMTGDAAGHAAALLALEQELPQLLAQARGELRLYPCDGTVFNWRGSDRWRWWRRPRAFSTYLAAARGAGGQTP